MAQYDLVGTYVAGDFAVASEVFADFTGIVSQLNGFLDDTNLANFAVTLDKLATNSVDANKIVVGAIRETHADYSDVNDGLLVARVGPNYFSGGEGGRFAFFQYEWVRDNSATQLISDISLTSSGNFLHGNPGFAAAPIMLGCPTVLDANANNAITGSRITAVTAADMDLQLEFAVGNNSETITITALLWGEV
jgi:hypothetical protein